MSDEKKITKATVTISVEYEDGTGYRREFHMDPETGVRISQDHPMDPKTKKRENEHPHLTVMGFFTGASNTPTKDPRTIDHRGFTF